MISGLESALDRLIQEGARKMLQGALDNEVSEYLEKMSRFPQTERLSGPTVCYLYASPRVSILIILRVSFSML